MTNKKNPDGPHDLTPDELVELFDQTTGHLTDAWIVLTELPPKGSSHEVRSYVVPRGDEHRTTKVSQHIANGKTPIGIIGYSKRSLDVEAVAVQFQHQAFPWMARNRDAARVADQILTQVGEQLKAVIHSEPN